MYNIIRTKNIWLGISAFLVIASIVAISIWGLRFGIDFTGGSLLQIKFGTTVQDPQKIETVLENANFGDVTVQPAGDEYILKMKPLTNDEKKAALENLQKTFGDTTETRFESIGPTLGKELEKKAVSAIVVTLLAIIIYISWAFRKTSSGPVRSWVYGAGAIIALIHDILIVIGVFSVLGFWKGVEVDSLFITAMLTILGFSVHDTIVVYDRIREHVKRGDQDTFADAINMSINSTMVRSINTSVTTLIVLTALLFFGGQSLRYFLLALIIGIISGTYSSIFVASPLLLFWEKWKQRK